MRKLSTAVAAITLVAFAAPAFAGSGCSGYDSKTVQSSDQPVSTATAPITPKPSGDGG